MDDDELWSYWNIAATAAGRESIDAMVTGLDSFLDVYSQTGAAGLQPPSDSTPLTSFHDRNRPLIYAGVLLATQNLESQTLPATPFPAEMLRGFVRDVLEHSRPTASRRLLAEIRVSEPRRWSVFVLAMFRLALSAARTGWPSPAISAWALRSLRELWSTWVDVAQRRRSTLSSADAREATHRRALHWHETCAWLLGSLATPKLGPHRIMVEYLWGLIRYYETSTESPAARDALVLEVFAYVSSFSSPVEHPPLYLSAGTRGLENDNRRKGVQRARRRAEALGIHSPGGNQIPDEIWRSWVEDWQRAP